MLSPITEYQAVLVYLAVAVAIAILAVSVGALLGPRKPSRPKLMPYESGNDPAGEVRRFPVHFYAVAMLFIIFDVEVAFLWPYAVSAGTLGAVGFGGLLIFTVLLFVGFLYEWFKGVMKWH
ncbi:NADH-quinone oxidoreductase subunit A [Meiothermus granaticius]|uniref:NADH-quinone oxidoreductase subunit A n=1 Tax=Meiothermus granaticius NBRC 107808 TaxID=1227551 RepID=A0A399F5F3_9DEIN|nr:NADH-quinone oxidoreductase subunit A [Meiothermus granaticius]MCL6527872.1 NADH-quinone oxidoreductase subunit A [Thermaceae bacterium]RIH91300.1 NADH-quinone oxidoreductase subunit 7 [Meiothermus granaticius NBRC 107808]GEM86133.1 NADH-quinone oxidoreductase subunit 7 [Meiothermus granaticius NBRC 107808]